MISKGTNKFYTLQFQKILGEKFKLFNKFKCLSKNVTKFWKHWKNPWYWVDFTQLTFTCSKLTTETLKTGVKYVQS